MDGVSTFRLYALRAAYLLIALGLGTMIWPGIINPPPDLEHMRSVVRALLGAMGLLAVLGIRYPLRMLPLLFFEFVWKIIWVAAFGAPLWAAGALDSATRSTLSDCLFGIVLCALAIPWGYVLDQYVRQRGDAWRRTRVPSIGEKVVLG
jgi:hypothetical protein